MPYMTLAPRFALPKPRLNKALWSPNARQVLTDTLPKQAPTADHCRQTQIKRTQPYTDPEQSEPWQ